MVAGTVVAQGFLWGMSDTTWNGCRVQVLDTTKEGLLVHVVEGTLSQGDEQAGRMLEVPRGAFWGLGLEETAPAHKAREAGLPTGTKKVMLQWGETGSGAPHFWNILPPGVASQLRQAPGRRKVVRRGAGQLEDELPETTTVFETPPDGLCLFHALARV